MHKKSVHRVQSLAPDESVQVCLHAESHSSQHVVGVALEQFRPDVVIAQPVYVVAPLDSHVFTQAEGHTDGEAVLVAVQFVHPNEQQVVEAELASHASVYVAVFVAGIVAVLM